MRKQIRSSIGIALIGLLPALAGCAPLRGLWPRQNNAAAALAAPAQSLLGAEAAGLSAAGRKQVLAAEYQALEHKKSGEAVAWRDAKSGASGSVIPGQPYRVGAQNCRQYSHNWQINGAPKTARGSACRNEDGTWTPLL